MHQSKAIETVFSGLL